jgi:hypothetical protein
MKICRILFTLLVTGIIARAEVPPSASTPTASNPMTKTEEGKEMLVGQWRFTYPPRGWAGNRNFQADGTLTGEGFGGVGRWTMSNNIVHIEYPRGDQEEMQLPLNPAGMKVRAHNGKTIVTAIKLSGDAKAPAAPVAPAASTPAPSGFLTETDEVKASLVGKWRFTYPPKGWAGSRNFKADGTLTGEGFGGVGKWTLSGNIVHIEYPSRDKEEMQVPLNPAGMKVRAQNGKVTVTAVKLTDDSKAPVTPPQANP